MGTSIGIELIAAERQRQIQVEGYTSDRDDVLSDGSLAIAAACYAMNSAWQRDNGIPLIWPWDDKCWKPKDQLSDLIRAGALIAAEIDRLQRVAEAAMED